MDRISHIFRLIFKEIFSFTYEEILEEHEILDRINYITSNIDKIEPINIYKCILYSNTANRIGKLAIDYRICFCSNNWKDTVKSGESYEIDNFQKQNSLFSQMLNDELINLNYSIENLILSFKNKEKTNIQDEFVNLTEFAFLTLNRVPFGVSINQECYIAVFEDLFYPEHLADLINCYEDGSDKSHIYNSIKHNHPTVCSFFEILKQKYKKIDKKYLKYSAFFG